jgi:hypothetical protein
MKWVIIVLAVVLGLFVLLMPIILLFAQPQDQRGTWLMAVRDLSIIYAGLFMCVGAILFTIVTVLIGYIALMIRDHIVPALEKADDTLQTVKGTTTFVSESVVAPIIKVAGAAAGARAMVQTLMRRKPPEADK